MKRERPVGFEEFTKTHSGIASIFLPAFFQSCSGGEGAQKRRPRLLILLPDSVFLVQACFIYRLVRYVGRARKHDGSIGQCIADPWTKQRLVKFLCRFSVLHQAFRPSTPTFEVRIVRIDKPEISLYSQMFPYLQIFLHICLGGRQRKRHHGTCDKCNRARKSFPAGRRIE